MAQTLHDAFQQGNQYIEGAKSTAEHYAGMFAADSTREDVMHVQMYCKALIPQLQGPQAAPGIDEYAAEQWGPEKPDFTDQTNEIIAAANAVLAWIQANFPTVRSTLNASMDALSIPPAQQTALRNQMGANLDYLLTHQIQGGSVVSPTLTAAQLAPLVTLLNAMAEAATI